MMQMFTYWFEAYQEKIMVYLVHWATALCLIIIGYFVSRFFSRSVIRVMDRRRVEPIVIDFTGYLIKYGLITVFFIAALGQVGVQTTSLVAMLGAAGLAIGLALQGTLSNFASGVLLIAFRPIKANEYIEVSGVAGTVTNLHIFSTTLVTPDNKTVIVPNNQLFQGNIVNYSRQGTRRIDLRVGVSYESNLCQTKAVLKKILEENTDVLSYPEPVISIAELGSSSVILNVRPWVKADNYWSVYSTLLEEIKLIFDQEGIIIPYPQMQLHMQKTEKKLAQETD